jgi:DNA-binding response OmpR family regulator
MRSAVDNSLENQRLEPIEILVVEDDYECRRALESILRYSGIEVDGVGTVAEALEKLTTSTRLLILDMNLPDGTGLDVLHAVRERGLAVKVAVTTATTERGLLDKLDLLRPDVIFRKPVCVPRLVGWIEEEA